MSRDFKGILEEILRVGDMRLGKIENFLSSLQVNNPVIQVLLV
jgi:hypothetical protein